MTARHWFLLLVPLAVLLAGGFLRGQDDVPSGTRKERDPFVEPAELRERLDELSGRERDQRQAEFLPQLVLQGYVVDGEGQSLALLQVGADSRFVVRAGERLTVAAQTGVLELEVLEIGRSGVILQMGKDKRAIALR